MKTLTTFIGIAALALMVAPVFAQKPAPVPVEKGWTSDLTKALAQAKREHKMVMVDFNATWCGPCQMYKKDVFPKAAFRSASKDLILVTIDTDQQPALAQKYKVEGIPDIRFLGPNGKEVGKVVGFGGEAPLIEHIKSAKKAAKL